MLEHKLVFSAVESSMKIKQMANGKIAMIVSEHPRIEVLSRDAWMLSCGNSR
jgi:hypothetical protein